MSAESLTVYFLILLPLYGAVYYFAYFFNGISTFLGYLIPNPFFYLVVLFNP